MTRLKLLPYITKFPSEEYCKQNCKLGIDLNDGWCSWVYETLGYMLDEKCPKVARVIDLIMDNANSENKCAKNPQTLLTIT